jgi:hypothetical protein
MIDHAARAAHLIDRRTRRRQSTRELPTEHVPRHDRRRWAHIAGPGIASAVCLNHARGSPMDGCMCVYMPAMITKPRTSFRSTGTRAERAIQYVSPVCHVNRLHHRRCTCN